MAGKHGNGPKAGRRHPFLSIQSRSPASSCIRCFWKRRSAFSSVVRESSSSVDGQDGAMAPVSGSTRWDTHAQVPASTTVQVRKIHAARSPPKRRSMKAFDLRSCLYSTRSVFFLWSRRVDRYKRGTGTGLDRLEASSLGGMCPLSYGPSLRLHPCQQPTSS